MTKMSTLCPAIFVPCGIDMHCECRNLSAFTDTFMQAPESSITDDHYTQLSWRLEALEERKEVNAANQPNSDSDERDT